MTPDLVFWYSPGACSLAVHITLLEAGLEFTPHSVDAVAGISESFRSINPKLKIPVLTIDGEVITEVPAILTAISQLRPDRKLLGATSLEVVRAYEWMNWLSGNLHGEAYGMVFRPGRYTDDERLYEDIRNKGRATVQQDYEYLESTLQREYAVGNDFTAVDAYIYVLYRWGVDQLGDDVMSRFPKLQKLVAKVQQRPAIIAALKAEGIKKY